MKILGALIISTIFTFVVFLIKQLFLTDSKRIKLVKKAMEQKHVIHAKLVKSKIVTRSNITQPQNRNLNESYDMGIYQYEYNGKIYKTKVLEQVGHLPNEIDLFYINNPRKATSEYNLGKTEMNCTKYFLISFILVLLIMYI